METRVLTLFDDEFFSEPELAKKKSEPVKKKKMMSSATEAQQVAVPDETEAVPVTDERTGDESAIVAKETAVPQETKDISAADERTLDQQMRSELLAMDYTAFIHKDFPFDPASAAVVIKDKEIALPKEATLVPPDQQTRSSEAEVKQVVEEEEEVKPLEAVGQHVTETMEEEQEAATVAPLPPFALEEKYYSIGEVAGMFAVNTSHIRFWTNEFKLKPRTTRKGGRLYLPEDIEQLRLIHHLVKEKKHTIKGAKEKLKQSKVLVENQLDLKTALEELKAQLLQIKQQL